MIALLGFKLAIPVEKIHPTVVQIIRRKLPPRVAQFFGGGLTRCFTEVHPRAAQAFGTFFEITFATGGNNVLPACNPPICARDNVIKSQIPLWIHNTDSKNYPSKIN